ncbi:MAG: LpxI family protein [Candidatus Pelagibacter sp.]
MIGLFLGEKKLPIEILKNLKKKKIKYFIIDLTKKNKFKKDKNSFFISIGRFGKILEIIKSKNCKKVIFAGNISKPKISKLKLDFKGIYYFPRIVKAFKLGDAAILKELIKILAEHNIKVIKLNFFNPELTMSSGNYTSIKPGKLEIMDIKKGIKYLNKLNAHNHTQGLVIRKGLLVAKETYTGTQKMLQNLKKLKNTNGILIKFPKKKQDLRADLPTIGLDTLKDCKKSNINGIVLKSNQNIILDKKKCIKFANKNKMFISIK